eukprot:Skav227479  [mRNA]  locus=scaffold2491:520064:520511:+ [translate_table: standard]
MSAADAAMGLREGGPSMASTSASDSDLMDIDVQCLGGEGIKFALNGSTLGSEVYEMTAEQLPSKRGSKVVLSHVDSLLMPHQTLAEQGIEGKMATLECTYVPADLSAAFRHIHGLPGVTQIAGMKAAAFPTALKA